MVRSIQPHRKTPASRGFSVFAGLLRRSLRPVVRQLVRQSANDRAAFCPGQPSSLTGNETEQGAFPAAPRSGNLVCI
jgi:hypothetical protein